MVKTAKGGIVTTPPFAIAVVIMTTAGSHQAARGAPWWPPLSGRVERLSAARLPAPSSISTDDVAN